MLQANDLRLMAVELRARARGETNPDFRSEFILLAERYEDLAETTENFLNAFNGRGSPQQR
jgi:hypothetical protein